MLNALNTVTVGYQAISRSDSIAASAASSPEASVSAESAGASAQGSAASPRMQFDPVAGVILQFLNTDGQVQTQSPSFAAVAYLKAGLTREGFSKEMEGDAITA